MPLTAPTSEVAILNLALVKLKEAPVMQIDPITKTSGKAEQLGNLLYHQVRRATLRSHIFNFSTKRILIGPDATAPLFEYTHAYDLPSDYIRYIARFDDLTQAFVPGQRGIDYDVSDGQYLFNGNDTTAIKFKYVFDATTVSKFDPLFVALFAQNLAIEMAPNFSKSRAVKNDLLAERLDIEAAAKGVDGQERPPVRKERSRSNNSRRSGMSGVAGKFTRFG